MNTLHIGSRREVCWDDALIDYSEGIEIRMHRPEYRGDALVCDKSWEGNVCCYFSLVHDGDLLRLYYRGKNYDVNADGTAADKVNTTTMCEAISYDGLTFQRINAGIVSRDGNTDNNILTEEIRDNMFFFKDTNPACPPESRFKALAEHHGGLCLFESADGVHFEEKRILADDGAYDSLNVCFWDELTQQYYLFYRGVHGEGSENGKWAKGANMKHTTAIRDIRVRTSRDFVNWSEPQMLQYGIDAEDLELYTNNVQKYYRAPHMFLGFPTRYMDRHNEPASFPHLPDYEHRQRYIQLAGRTGTVMTDTCIMTSRDGIYFRRTDEAFMTPGPERGLNWYYGDGYLCYGMAQTPSVIPGAPNEISIYMPVNYRADNVILRRYALRLDGFFSWHCGFKPGKVVTKPLTFTGDSLQLNFATSSLGSVRVRILDTDGNPIEGFDSGNHFGDTIDRPIGFEKSLSQIAGKPVRLEFTLKDAELYSFRFA